jgi:hypothetical protein
LEFILYTLFTLIVFLIFITIQSDKSHKNNDLITEYFEILKKPLSNRNDLLNHWESKALQSLNSKKSNLKIVKNEDNIYYLEKSD